MQTKKISVIVPNYNYARYLNKRIDSILKQTYPIYELIILDDKSTDDSIEIIKNKIGSVKVKYPSLNVKIVKNTNNSGKAILQWKKGIEIAQGDYIWIAEADDLSNKRFLEEVMKGFDDSKVIISYTESRVINKNGLMIVPNFRWSRDKEKTGHYKKSYIKDGEQEIEEIMAIRCTIPNVSSAVFKKKCLKSSILDEAAKFSQVGDWYLYLKLLENGKISYNKKPLNYFRVHGDSVTDKAKKSEKHLEEIEFIQKMMRKQYKLSEIVIRYQNSEYNRIRQRINND